MPGNSRSGRRPDPTRPTAPKAEGEPVRPKFRFPEAGRLWDTVVPWMVKRGFAGGCDSAELQAMCEQWALYRACIDVIADNVEKAVDKDMRIAATSYLAAFDKLAARFGLTPADRGRLNVAAPNAADDDLKEFGIVA